MDFVITRNIHRLKQAFIVNDLTSDHFPVLFQDGTIPIIQVDNRPRYRYGLANWKLFGDAITEYIKLNNEMRDVTTDNTDELVEILERALKQ